MAALNGSGLNTPLKLTDLRKEHIHADRHTHVEVLHGQTDKILGRRALQERKRLQQRFKQLDLRKRRQIFLVVLILVKSVNIFLFFAKKTEWGKAQRLIQVLRSTITVQLRLKQAVRHASARRIRIFVRAQQHAFSDDYAKQKGMDADSLIHKNKNTCLCFIISASSRIFLAKALKAQRILREYGQCQKARVEALCLLRRKIKKCASVHHHVQKPAQHQRIDDDVFLTPLEKMKARKEAKIKENEVKLQQAHKQTKILLELYAGPYEPEPHHCHSAARGSSQDGQRQACRELLWKLRREHVRKCIHIDAESRKCTVQAAKQAILGSKVKSAARIKPRMPQFILLTKAHNIFNHQE
jgi:hypothetical protein